MTANELIHLLNEKFSPINSAYYEVDNHNLGPSPIIERPWPNFYEVDHETYANCCQAVFDSLEDYAAMTGRENVQFFTIALGANKGLMFKNIELRLKSRSMM